MVEKKRVALMLRVKRENAREPHGGQLDQFQLESDSESTVLDLLMEAGVLDQSLLFRHSCHHGSCGTCACIINGKERLACRTLVGELLEDDKAANPPVIEVAPLKGFRVIKDLVYDPSGMFDKIDVEWSYLTAYQHQNHHHDNHHHDHSGKKFESCIECGACISACPVIAPLQKLSVSNEVNPFQGPAPLAMLHRQLEELDRGGLSPVPRSTGPGSTHPGTSRELIQSSSGENREQSAQGALQAYSLEQRRQALIDQAARADGAAACQRHIECSRVCPQNVAPARRIQQLKNLLGI
jgi:succinate dehydrogenase/fumarate reductase iron-sulfur protein